MCPKSKSKTTFKWEQKCIHYQLRLDDGKRFKNFSSITLTVDLSPALLTVRLGTLRRMHPCEIV